MGHPKETLVFPSWMLPPSQTPATQQLSLGGADLQQVMEVVDVGDKIGCKDGAVPGSAPRHKLLLKPVGEDTQVTLTVGEPQIAHLLCTQWCQEALVAGSTCPLCIRTCFFQLS